MSILLEVIARSTRLGDKSKEEYTRCVGRFVKFAGDNPNNWNGSVVEQWRDVLRVDLGPSTVNKHLYALRYASKRLEGLGVGPDFARAAESVPAPKGRKRKAMTLGEVQALLATCDANRPHDIRDRAIITIALRTGLRASNLVGLTWGRIKGRVADCVIKGNKNHQVILDDRCLAALQAWADCLETYDAGVTRGPVVRSVRVLDRTDGIFAIGKPVTRRQWVNEMLKARATEAGIKVHPHLFRHTFVSWALEAGVAPHRVMRQTGHSNMATLSQYVTDLEAETNPIGDHLPEF
jgi:integrase